MVVWTQKTRFVGEGTIQPFMTWCCLLVLTCPDRRASTYLLLAQYLRDTCSVPTRYLHGTCALIYLFGTYVLLAQYLREACLVPMRYLHDGYELLLTSTLNIYRKHKRRALYLSFHLVFGFSCILFKNLICFYNTRAKSPPYGRHRAEAGGGGVPQPRTICQDPTGRWPARCMLYI